MKTLQFKIQNQKGKMLAQNQTWSVFYFRGRFSFINRRDSSLSFSRKMGAPGWKKIAAKIPLLARLFRIEPRCAVFLDENTVLISCGKILRFDLISGLCVIEHLFRSGMSNVLSFCKDGNNVYYGEYFENPERQPVGVFLRGPDGWNKVFEFGPGAIKHIHQIVKCEDGFLIATGDSAEESAIWRADPSFSKVEKFLYGGEVFRTCSLVNTPDSLFFAGDSTSEPNFIFRYDKQTKELTRIISISGPCIFHISNENGFALFSTSVEPDVRLPRFRYLFGRSLAQSVRDNYSRLYLLFINEGRAMEIFQIQKDIYPAGAFKFGTISFASSSATERSLFLYFEAVKKLGGRTAELPLEEIMKYASH